MRREALSFFLTARRNDDPTASGSGFTLFLRTPRTTVNASDQDAKDVRRALVTSFTL